MVKNLKDGKILAGRSRDLGPPTQCTYKGWRPAFLRTQEDPKSRGRHLLWPPALQPWAAFPPGPFHLTTQDQDPGPRSPPIPGGRAGDPREARKAPGGQEAAQGPALRGTSSSSCFPGGAEGEGRLPAPAPAAGPGAALAKRRPRLARRRGRAGVGRGRPRSEFEPQPPLPGLPERSGGGGRRPRRGAGGARRAGRGRSLPGRHGNGAVISNPGAVPVARCQGARVLQDSGNLLRPRA